jgi:phosphoglycolate phosphatase
MRVYSHVYFDLDGTLIDQFDAIHRSFCHAAMVLGLELPSYEKVLRTVGGSVPVTASRLFPGAEASRVAELFEQRFDEVMLERVRVMSGAFELLGWLRKSGVRSVVFTNKREDKAIKTCEHLGICDWVDGIAGTGTAPGRKPERAFSLWALDRFGASADRACVVGDSPFDEASAQVVGMDCFLVATGSHLAETLREETRSAVFPDLHALAQEVFDMPRDFVHT